MLDEPVLVIGAAGMLGRAVMQALGQAGLRHEGSDRSRVDLSSVDSIARGVHLDSHELGLRSVG